MKKTTLLLVALFVAVASFDGDAQTRKVATKRPATAKTTLRQQSPKGVQINFKEEIRGISEMGDYLLVLTDYYGNNVVYIIDKNSGDVRLGIDGKSSGRAGGKQIVDIAATPEGAVLYADPNDLNLFNFNDPANPISVRKNFSTGYKSRLCLDSSKKYFVANDGARLFIAGLPALNVIFDKDFLVTKAVVQPDGNFWATTVLQPQGIDGQSSEYLVYYDTATDKYRYWNLRNGGAFPGVDTRGVADMQILPDGNVAFVVGRSIFVHPQGHDGAMTELLKVSPEYRPIVDFAVDKDGNILVRLENNATANWALFSKGNYANPQYIKELGTGIPLSTGRGEIMVPSPKEMMYDSKGNLVSCYGKTITVVNPGGVLQGYSKIAGHSITLNQ